MTAASLIIGILLLIAGVVVFWKQRWLFETIGRVDFAERKLGGTINLIMLLGLLCIIMGFVFLAGCIEPAAPGSNLEDLQIKY